LLIEIEDVYKQEADKPEEKKWNSYKIY
jgi:hypothetical protein